MLTAGDTKTCPDKNDIIKSNSRLINVFSLYFGFSVTIKIINIVNIIRDPISP